MLQQLHNLFLRFCVIRNTWVISNSLYNNTYCNTHTHTNIETHTHPLTHTLTQTHTHIIYIYIFRERETSRMQSFNMSIASADGQKLECFK
jgi:hypothetical protein